MLNCENRVLVSGFTQFKVNHTDPELAAQFGRMKREACIDPTPT